MPINSIKRLLQSFLIVSKGYCEIIFDKHIYKNIYQQREAEYLDSKNTK